MSAVKIGYLSKLPVKGFVKKWNRRWFTLYGTSHEGVVRLEYFDSQESSKTGAGKRTIPLRESKGIEMATGDKTHPYVFQFTSQIGHHVLAADSQPELEEWIKAIKRAVQEDRLSRRRSKGQSVVVTPSDDASFGSLNESGGISYKNRVDSGTYRVTVEETELSTKMCLSGAYSLELTPTMISLAAPSGAKIFTLSYRYLKNYGKQSGQFNFFTGKNAPIGEGKLIFVTTCSKEIFGVVHNNIKRMRENAGPVSRQKSDSDLQQEPVRRTSQTRPVPRPQPARSVPAPPQPQKQQQQQQKQQQQPLGATNRPGSRHSSEIAESSMPGTYRKSKNLEEPAKVTVSNENDLYTAVDMNKKRILRQNKKKEVPSPPKPFSNKEQSPSKGKGPAKGSGQGSDEPLYSLPYEEDPAYKAPPVPHHKTSTSHDPRTSTELVDLEEENAFDDSFEEGDDDGDDNNANLEPLEEGVSNPLDAINFGAAEAQQPDEPNLVTADDVNEELQRLDFGFGPGNLEPQPKAAATTIANTTVADPTITSVADPIIADPTIASAANPSVANPTFSSVTSPSIASVADPITASAAPIIAGPTVTNPEDSQATTLDLQNEANFNFDFDLGGDLGAFPPTTKEDDPFSSNFGATGTKDLADFDLGTLDANFFEKLEAIEVTDQQSPAAPWGSGTNNELFGNQEFDQFWSDKNTFTS